MHSLLTARQGTAHWSLQLRTLSSHVLICAQMQRRLVCFCDMQARPPQSTTARTSRLTGQDSARQLMPASPVCLREAATARNQCSLAWILPLSLLVGPQRSRPAGNLRLQLYRTLHWHSSLLSSLKIPARLQSRRVPRPSLVMMGRLSQAAIVLPLR